MSCQPGGDTQAWERVLAHRPPELRTTVADRFTESGLTVDQVQCALDDLGDQLYAAAESADDDWAERFGGPLAAALLAAEVSSLAAHLNSRGSAVRALAVEVLLDDFSAVTVAAGLGVSRQKVYDIARGKDTGPFVEHALGGRRG